MLLEGGLEMMALPLTAKSERLSHGTHSSGGAVKPCRWMDTLPGPLVLYPLRDVMQQPSQAKQRAIAEVVLGSALLVVLHIGLVYVDGRAVCRSAIIRSQLLSVV
jgi:hypothetical protein